MSRQGIESATFDAAFVAESGRRAVAMAVVVGRFRGGEGRSSSRGRGTVTRQVAIELNLRRKVATASPAEKLALIERTWKIFEIYKIKDM